jgi:type IV pilus assembly protein PilA
MKMAIRGFTLLELMVTIAIVGILSAISLPNFLKLQARAKQTEVKANLRALADLEKAYYQEFDSYTPYVGQLGFSPERGNRYAYLLASSPTFDNRTGTMAYTTTNATAISVDTFSFVTQTSNPSFTAESGCAYSVYVYTGEAGSFTAAAVGNVDGDYTTDQWSISSDSRDMSTCADVARHVPAFTPANERDDVVR